MSSKEAVVGEDQAGVPESAEPAEPSGQSATPPKTLSAATLVPQHTDVAQEKSASSSKTGVTSSKTGITSSTTDVRSSKTGIASSQTGILSSKIDVTSSKMTASSSKNKLEVAASQQQVEPVVRSEIEAASGDKVSPSKTGSLGAKVSLRSSFDRPSMTKTVESPSTGKVASTSGLSKVQGSFVSPSVTSLKPSPSKSLRTSGIQKLPHESRASLTRERQSFTKERHYSNISSLSFRNITEQEKFKTAKYMNTYRLESKQPFNPERVENVMKEVLTRELEAVQYDHAAAPKIAMQISGEIRTKVKALAFDRYKIVVTVDIGEKQMHSIHSGFRFLWDTERDKYAIYTFENMTLFAVACCFGVYYD